MALLDSQKPDPATPMIEEQPFDPDTGEIVEPQLTPPAEPEQLPEAPEMPAAPEPEQQPRQPRSFPVEEEPDAVQATPSAPEPEEEQEAPDVDEMGITKPPEYAAAEKQANDYISRARACENIIDFRKLEKEAELVVASMPEEIMACVDTEFEHTRQRLKPAKAEA